MKLTFKDLKQQKFTIDAEPTETIGQVKEKISAEKGWEASTQKLIYSGKILQDDNTIESYKIEEKGFIVCMTSKVREPPKGAVSSNGMQSLIIRQPKAAPSKPAEPSTPAQPAQPASTPAAPAAPVASEPSVSSTAAQIPATPTPAPASTATTSEERSFNDPSALAMGDQRAAAIASMEAMGFPREEIDRAMRAAFSNPDRAVEYLLNGIPASAMQDERPAAASPRPASNQGQGQQPPAAAMPTTTGAETAAGPGEEPVNLFEQAAAQVGGNRGGTRSGAGNPAAAPAAGQGGAPGSGTTPSATLDFLRNNPQFQQLRQVVQQQPTMLEPILNQVAAGNPQLAQMIAQNQEQFLQLLAEDVDDDVALPPGTQQIAVTEEERDAIERVS